MDLERAFLDDVIERPDDDAPRLVYADWLEDKGDPERADFIRTQCRLAAMGEGDLARPELRRREKELLDAHAVRWAEPLRGMASEWGFSRGLIDFVRLNGNHDIDLAGVSSLFDLAPIEALTLEEFGADTVSGLHSVRRQLTRLRYLDVFGMGGVKAAETRSFLNSPALSRLKTFFIDQGPADEFPVQVLVTLGQSPALSALTTLGVALGDRRGSLPAGAVREIATSRYLRPERLYLVNAHLDSPILRSVDLRGLALQGLAVLSLEHCTTHQGLWDELLRAGAFPNIQSLRLYRVNIDAATRQALVERFGEDKVDFGPLDDGEFFPRRRGHTWPSH